MTPPAPERWDRLRSLAAWIVGCIFIYAAVMKIADPAQFARDIKGFKLLPLSGVHALAILLPWWELGAGLALLAPAWRRSGAALVSVFLLVFVGAIASTIIRRMTIRCGCFGKENAETGVRALVQDIAMLVAVAAVWWGPSKRSGGGPPGAVNLEVSPAF